MRCHHKLIRQVRRDRRARAYARIRWASEQDQYLCRMCTRTRLSSARPGKSQGTRLTAVVFISVRARNHPLSKRRNANRKKSRDFGSPSSTYFRCSATLPGCRIVMTIGHRACESQKSASKNSPTTSAVLSRLSAWLPHMISVPGTHQTGLRSRKTQSASATNHSENGRHPQRRRSNDKSSLFRWSAHKNHSARFSCARQFFTQPRSKAEVGFRMPRFPFLSTIAPTFSDRRVARAGGRRPTADCPRV